MNKQNAELLESKVIQTYWKKKITSIKQESFNQEFLYSTEKESQFAVEEINFAEQTVNRINELCNDNELLVFIFHLSVLSILLNKYTGCEEVIIGSKKLKTDLEAAPENIIFYKGIVSSEITFKELYGTLKNEIIETDNYCNIPVSEFLNIVHSNELKQLFKFGFSYSNLCDDANLSSLSDVIFKLASPSKLEVKYDAGNYKPLLMLYLLQNYVTLLEDVLGDLYKPVGDYKYLSNEERELQITDFNRSNYPVFQTDAPYINLFEQQVIKSPSAVAVISGSLQLTYQQLNEQADAFAAFLLQDRSIAAAPVIALVMERTERLMIAILAIWKCGKAYVPIDSIYPLDRIQTIIGESKVKFIITDEVNKNLLTEKDELRIINYDAIQYQPVAKKQKTQRELSDLSYIIYTSGSTGKPKGVMIDHLGMINHIGAKIMEFQITDSSVVAQNASQGFDISVWQLFAALIVGGKTVIINNEQVFDVCAFADEISEKKIDILEVVPSYLKELMEYLEENTFEKKFALRYLIVNAETLKHNLVEKWLNRYPHIKIVNTYGATEVSDDISHYIMTSVPDIQTIPVMKGPIQNMTLYIVDENLQLRPVGVKGEICIGGIGVGPGYFNDEEKTVKSFLNDTITGNAGKIYRTGDLGRFLCDGTLEFLGRNDFQVKVNGFRVELSEIESVMMQINGIKDILVLAKTDKNDKSTLYAYFVCDEPENYDTEDIRKFLKNRLPDYMIPVFFIGLQKFPLNENGKINRKLLPNPEISGKRKTGIKATTKTEMKLAAIWQTVLKVSEVDVEDNFFELGGHSLLATKIVSGIAAEFNVRLSIRTIFEKQTIKELSEEIDAHLAGAKGDSIPEIKRVARNQTHPMSSAQQRIWFFDQMGNKAGAYNIFDALAIKGNVNKELFEQAVNRLVDKHEILRTTFKVINNEPTQIISNNSNYKFDYKELLNLSAAEQLDILKELMKKEAEIEFDLEQGPLLRVTLIKFEAEHHVLILNMHHIITDRWSVDVFVNDFMNLYHDSNNSQHSLPEETLQYVDFSHWQKQLIDTGVFEKQLNYWKEKLNDVPHYLDMPLDFKRPAIKSYKGAKCNFSFNDDIKMELEKLTASEGVSTYMAVLAAFSILLSKYSGQKDFVIGSPIANRHYKELESMIGFFVNTLGMRVKIDMDKSFLDLLREVRTTTLEAYANQDLPFEKLIEHLKVERNESFSPLFQVMIGMQNVPESETAIHEWETENIDFGSAKSKFDLELSLEDRNNTLSGFIEYSTDVFKESTVIRMISHFKNLMSNVIKNKERKLKDIQLTDSNEIQLLNSFNNTFYKYDEKETITRLFEERAKTDSKKNAIIYDDERISYAELNSRANKLSNFLISKGCEKGSVVGVCIERSIDLVVGILAILKAGAAYLPLDPVYPVNRLKYMTDDSDIKLIITKNEHTDKFNASGRTVISIDKLADSISQQADTNPVIEKHGEDLFYIIYTSGSTGQPKGVEGLHKGMVNRLNWVWKHYPFKEGEVCCQKAAISFGESISEIFSPLLQGIPCVIIPDEVLKDPQLLIKSLRENKVSRIVLVPSYLKELLQTFPNLGELLPDLCAWTSSGEALTENIIDEFNLKVPNATLLNFYGSTEISADVTFYNTKENIASGNVSIGLPIHNTQVYVFDEYMQRNPIGIPGELFIGGLNVARGYYKKEQLTAERFIQNPLKDTKDILFKTGDLVRFLSNGNLEFYGRKDNQVKIRGQRVETGEIEACLLKHPGIKNTIIHVDIDKHGEQRLVAYIVINKGHAPHMNEISKYLKEQLPLHMIPSVLVELEKIPLLPNGKLDKSALPKVEIDELADATKLLPRNKMEKLIFDIWKDLLPFDQFSIRDNFFDVGGHSLLAIRLVNQIKLKQGTQLPIAEIFKSPTIEKLAVRLLKSEEVMTGEKSLVPIQPKGNKTPLFFVPGVGGSVLYLNDLSKALGTDQPFYGLQSIGLDGISEPVKDIKTMAANYIKEIQEVQKSGPYKLAGHSFGGKVAFEISQQLLNKNEEVSFLGIVEMNAPDPNYVHPDVSEWDEIHWYVEVLKTVDLYYGKSKKVYYEDFLKIEKDKHIKYLKSILEEAEFLEPNSDMKQFEAFLRVLKTNFQATYPPPTVYKPLNICVFLSEENAPDGTMKEVPSQYQNLSDWGWNNFSSKEVKVYTVPGNHHTLMQNPNALILADNFKTELN